MLHVLFEIGRRALWLLTVVLALSIVTFALAPTPTQSGNLPLFVNPHPKNSNTYAWALAQDVALDDSTSAWSAHELVRLGAVALPAVLPKLDSLPPEGRARVLLALEPVAQRMGLTPSGRSAAQLSSTWLSFLSDNSVYLHPAMAKRLVARFVADPSAQHARDLRRLDTFALPELIRALNMSTQSPSDAASLRNIVEVLRQITGHDASWSLPPEGEPIDHEYRAVVEKWRNWWFAQRHLYEPQTPTGHLIAPLLQTQFALWVRGGKGAWLERGVIDSLSVVPWLAVLRSVSLFVFALFGGNALTRLCNQAASPWMAHVRGGISSLGWLPPALLAIGAHRVGLRGMWIALPLVALCGAALTLRDSRTKVQSRQVQSAFAGPHASTYAATLLSTCLVVEWGLSVDGLGPLVVAAIKRADATPVLCVALVNTLLIGIVQFFGTRQASQVA